MIPGVRYLPDASTLTALAGALTGSPHPGNLAIVYPYVACSSVPWVTVITVALVMTMSCVAVPFTGAAESCAWQTAAHSSRTTTEEGPFNGSCPLDCGI